MSKLIELPIIICGEIKMPQDDYIELKYSDDVIVHITRPSKEDLRRIYDYNEDLNSLSFIELAKYITQFAKRFLDDDNENRQRAIELSPYVTGYTKEMLKMDYDVICDHLSKLYNIYDAVSAEFTTYRIMDEWVTNQLCKVRAFPRGRAFHVLVGNVPMTGIFSIFRSIMTKNQTVVKLPARDLVSTLFFVKGLIEENADDMEFQRMLNSSISVFYLEHDDETIKELVESSDVVCAWGKGNTMKSIKEMVPHSVPYLEFGPKRSFALLYADECDPDKAAVRMAHDLSLYDQEACLSPQRLFVIGKYDAYLESLKKWLDWQARYLKRGILNDDAESFILRTKLEAQYAGNEVIAGEPQWRIIVCDPYEVNQHPLGRTLFVHPIEKEEDMLPFIDEETQSVSVFPYSQKMEKLADLLCNKGVSKLCETGMTFYPREGWTHDGLYPLHYFVRLCYMDATSEYEYKYDPEEEDALRYLSNMYGRVPMEELVDLLGYFAV